MTVEQRKNGHGAAPIMVTLPGGHEIRARLHARCQTKDGWRYQVGVLICIHVIGCTPSDQILDREQALTALHQPRAAACRECGAAESLTDHKGPPGQESQTPTPPRAPD